MLILKRKKVWMPAGFERVRACFHPTLYSYIRLPCTWLASLYVDIPARFVEQAQDAEFRHFEKSNTDACPFFLSRVCIRSFVLFVVDVCVVTFHYCMPIV